jgi:lysozyme family protein
MEAAMDSGSVRATMSIFGESISGRKAEKNRGHALTQEVLSQILNSCFWEQVGTTV